MSDSTDLDIPTDPATQGVTPAPFSTGGNMIREAAAVMSDAMALSKAICDTQMIPAHFRGKPAECAAAILYGASIGLDPMQAVKGIYVVHGNAALYARTMASIVLRDGHDVWTVETNDTTVTVAGRRRGWPQDRAEVCTWTIERATKAGYTSNAKYKSDPQAMLYAKAVSEVCRKIAPDSLSGVYSVEELQLEPVQATVTSTSPALAATFTAPRPAAGGGVTDQQRDALTAAFYDAGIDKAGQWAYIPDVIGREPSQDEPLTADEAEQVLARLRDQFGGDQ